MFSFIHKAGRLVRSNNWWNYKVPSLLAFAYLFLLLYPVEPDEALFRFFLLMLWVIGAAGFGHYVNDCFDIEADRIAGKPNAAAEHTVTKRWAVSLALATLALLPWLYLSPDVLTYGLVVFHLLLFLLYSVPPVRLKERSLPGVITDALYAHILPNLIATRTFYHGSYEGSLAIFIALLIIWSYLSGMRNIISHQVADYENDARSATQTLVRAIGKASSANVIKWILLPLELLSFILLWIIVASPLWVVSLAFILFLLYKYWLNRWVWKQDAGSNYGINLYNSLFNNFYETWMPVVILLMLCAIQPFFIILLILHLALFSQVVRSTANELKSIFNR